MTKNYGAGEIFGRDITKLSASELRAQLESDHNKCPYNPHLKHCSKSGGVCTLREYSDDSGEVLPVSEKLITICPCRFTQNREIFIWVGEVLLKTTNPVVLTELPFLRPVHAVGDGREVGKIDVVLVHPDTTLLRWCALEMQAVYFSGASMSQELDRLATWSGDGIPMPKGRRHPDFRSSGPKRLMPQLQIKVPSISRWGRKTAVVVDEAFWNSLAPMSEVDDISNCDIAWFVVRYDCKDNDWVLQRGDLHLTTLERAVEGLTAGIPTSLGEFERRLTEKLRRAGFQPGHVPTY